MSKHLRRWPKPSSYKHTTGVIEKRKSSLRYILPLIIIVNGAVLLAFMQLSRQYDASAASTGLNDQPVKVEKLPDPKTPAASAPIQEKVAYQDAGLQQILDDWSAQHPGTDWSVVVRGMDGDNRSASVRAKSWYNPASLYKLLLTYNFFQRYGLDDLDSHNLYLNGNKRTYRSCFEAMIKISDNPCGEAFGNQLGWGRLDASLRTVGLKETQLNRKDTIFTNASDVSLYLEKLYNGTLLSKEKRDYLIGLMQQQKFRSGIPAGCQSCIIADKTGDLTNVRHDAAIVNSKGHTYILVIMTSGAQYKQIAELTQLINNYMTTNP